MSGNHSEPVEGPCPTCGQSDDPFPTEDQIHDMQNRVMAMVISHVRYETGGATAEDTKEVFDAIMTPEVDLFGYASTCTQFAAIVISALCKTQGIDPVSYLQKLALVSAK